MDAMRLMSLFVIIAQTSVRVCLKLLCKSFKVFLKTSKFCTTLYVCWIHDFKVSFFNRVQHFCAKVLYTVLGAMREPNFQWQSNKSHCIHVKIKSIEPLTETNFCERQRFKNVTFKLRYHIQRDTSQLITKHEPLQCATSNDTSILFICTLFLFMNT